MFFSSFLLLCYVVSLSQGTPFQSGNVHSRHKKDISSSSLTLSSFSTISCSTCAAGVTALQMMAKANIPTNVAFGNAKVFCAALGELSVACNRVVQAFGEEVLYVLRVGTISPRSICASLFSLCPSAKDPLEHLWKMNIPSKKPTVRAWPTVKPNSPALRVLHLTDIHIDFSYREGEEADCPIASLSGIYSVGLCCRKQESRLPKGAVKQPAGFWGTTNAVCDLPYRTFESALRHINRTEKLDYILVTGDFIAHDEWNYSRTRSTVEIKNVTDTLKRYFPTTPIYQAVGNHEGVPTDGFASHSIDNYDQYGPGWLYDQLAQQWTTPHWSATNGKDVKYRASYAVYPRKGLKLISFNSIYCSKINFYTLLNQTDPDQTLQWLTQQLLDSERNGEKVHLISHIPSGDSYCLRGWANNFKKIVHRFENTIAAQFYGHNHGDTFEVFYDNSTLLPRPFHYSFVSPSLTTFSNNNPAYRIYTIDGEYEGSSYTVVDAETYYANLTEANENNKEPEWKLEYTTRETFGMNDLSPDAWNRVIHRLENERDLFEEYHRFFYRNDNNVSCRTDSACVQFFTSQLKNVF